MNQLQLAFPDAEINEGLLNFGMNEQNIKEANALIATKVFNQLKDVVKLFPKGMKAMATNIFFAKCNHLLSENPESNAVQGYDKYRLMVEAIAETLHQYPANLLAMVDDLADDIAEQADELLNQRIADLTKGMPMVAPMLPMITEHVGSIQVELENMIRTEVRSAIEQEFAS